MNNPITPPKLTEAQLDDVLTRYAAGQTVRRIATETQLPYAGVYFHTVSGGKMDTRVITCRCGTENYGFGLCQPCYDRARRVRLAAAKKAA